MPANGVGTAYVAEFVREDRRNTVAVIVLRQRTGGAEAARSDDKICHGDAWRIVQRGSGAESLHLLSPRQTDPP